MKRKKRKITFRLTHRSGIRADDSSVKREVYGLLLFSIGVLFFLSLISYHQTDPVTWSLGDNNQYTRVQNYLGIAGATLARPVFSYTFGYASLVFPLLIMILGIALMTNYSIRRLIRLMVLSVVWAFFISIVLAMPESLRTFGKTQNYFPSGLLGGMTSDLLARFFGKFALLFISAIFFLVLLMITFRFRLSIIPIYLAQMIRKTIRITFTFFKNVFTRLRKIQWLPTHPNRIPFRRKSKPTPAVEQRPEEPVHDLSHIDELTSPDTIQSGIAEDYPPAQPVGSPGSGNGPSGQDDLPPVAPPPQEAPAQALPESGFQPVASDDAYIFPEKEPAPEVKELPPDKPFDYDQRIRESLSQYELPPVELLREDKMEGKISREELMANADLLENTLAQFGVKAFVKKVIEGPVITLYAVRPAEGVKINQIVSLADDLALAMRAKGIRMIAPIPGEAAIGIEIPNRRPSIVSFRSIVTSEKFQTHNGKLVLGMGKTIGGDVFCADLTRMPHLLIAGSTGSGKSVGINTIIASILYRVPPSDVKFVLIDPKKLELSLYTRLKDHYLAICPDLDEIVVTHPQNAIMILRSVVNEMEERYDILASVGVRDIVSFNEKIAKLEERGEKPDNIRRLPYIVVIIDELADLILTAAREVEEPITRLAQMARAVGIHLIVATQRPSVDILTGLIKANFPTRIAYQVATRPDSKVILDMYGAEKLIGHGDMLFLPPGTGKPVRLQNPFISTEEIETLLKYIRKQPKFPPYELKLMRERPVPTGAGIRKFEQDDLFEKAKEIVVRHQQGSISLLQRKLKIGYARAARLIDELEEAGVVGPGQGSKAREVLISSFDNEKL